jgi:hypothetical protein
MTDAPVFEIDAALRIIEDTITKHCFVPTFPIELKSRQGAVPDATAIHCQWPLAEKGPYSREVTVMIAAGAMRRFRRADAKARGEMLEHFVRAFRIRLTEGGYNEQDPWLPPFIIHIDEHSIEP